MAGSTNSMRVLCGQPLAVIRHSCSDRSELWRPLSGVYTRLWVRHASREPVSAAVKAYHVEQRVNRVHVASSTVETSSSKGFLRGLASDERGNMDFRKVCKFMTGRVAIVG